MFIFKSFDLDLVPGEKPPKIRVSQFDIGRDFGARLFDNGSAFTIPSGFTAKVEGSLGLYGFSEDASIDDNMILFTLSEEMTSVEGPIWCKIRLIKDDISVSTCAFILDVNRAGIDAQTVSRMPGFSQQIIDAVDDYMDDHVSVFNAANGYSAIPPVYDRKEAEIVKVAKSYYINREDTNHNPRFIYNWHNTYRSNPFILGNIDCSAFVGLVIRGILYADSPYGQAYSTGKTIGTEITNDPDDWVCNPAMSWAINPRDYWCLGNYKSDMDEGDSDDSSSVDSDIPAQGRPVSAANLAQLLITFGDVVPITNGFDAIRPGDILFWAPKKDGAYIRPNRYLHIAHTAVVVDIENGQHWFVDSMSDPEDGPPLENTIRRECLETTDRPKAEYLVLVIRLRQGRAWKRLRILYPPMDATVEVGNVQRFSCIADGDCVRYRWQFSDDNGTTWVDSSLAHSSTIFVTVADGMNNRLYHCLCTDTHGRTVTSRGAKITINAGS